MSSPRLNPAIARRALKDILRGLAERRLTQTLVDRANDFTKPIRVCTFPAFTLFTPGKKFPPYKWFLPKPDKPIVRFLEAYEQLATRDAHSRSTPGVIASRVYSWASDKSEFVRSFRDDGDWRAAATLLVAAGQWLGAEVEVANEDLVRARLGPGLLEVSEQGCWSATNRRAFSIFKASAPTWPVTAFPATQTTNNYLMALAELREALDPNLQYAGTVLAAALNQKAVTPDWLREAVADALILSRVQKVKLNNKVERASAALVQCSEVLDRTECNVVPALYEAAVPGLMGSRMFRSLFGVPSQTNPDRVTPEETRQRWQQVLDELYEELQSANT